MTIEEFRKKVMDFNEQEAKIHNKKLRFKAEFISKLPYKVGDKVFVEGLGKGWLRSVSITDYGRLTVSLYPVKKNGEPSKKFLCSSHLDLNDVILDGKDS